MGFQFFKLLFGQSTSVAHLTVSFHVAHRAHPWNDGGHGRVTQHIAQRRFSHLIQSDSQIGSNLLHALIDLLLAIAPKLSIPEIARLKGGVRRDFSSQSPLIQCYPYNHAHLVTVTRRKQPIFRALLENIIDHLNRIDDAGLN